MTRLVRSVGALKAGEKRPVRRRAVNQLMVGLTAGATLLALLPLVLIIAYAIHRGIGALSAAFFTETFKPIQFGSDAAQGGVLHAIVGSLLITGAALVMASPIGILAGVFLAERQSGMLTGAVRFCNDILSAMPSIVVGVTAYVLIVQRTRAFSGFAGSAALAVLMVPTIARTTEEMLRLIPRGIREASAALGMPVWRTTLQVVLPMAVGGITTGVLLALARAAGETAPLLVTVLGNNNLSLNLFGPLQALPLLAYRYTDQPYASMNQQAWGAALLLIFFVLGTNLVVRLVLRGRNSGMGQR